MDVEFKPDFSYGTTVADDGITHIIDETKPKPVYHFSLTETYIFDAGEPEIELKLINRVLRDLDRVKDTLIEIRDKRTPTKNEQEQFKEIEL